MDGRLLHRLIRANFSPKFKILSSKLDIDEIDFIQNEISGSVSYEISISDQFDGSLKINENFSLVKNCYILCYISGKYIPLDKENLSSEHFSSSFFNSTEFTYKNPLSVVSLIQKKTDLGFFGNQYLIYIPSTFVYHKKNEKMFQIKINFSYKTRKNLDDISLGSRDSFVTPFNCRSPNGSSNICEWFPCVDYPFITSKWTIKIACQLDNLVICSGTRVKEDINLDRKVIVHSVNYSTTAGYIGFIVCKDSSRFVSLECVAGDANRKIKVLCEKEFKPFLEITCSIFKEFINHYNIYFNVENQNNCLNTIVFMNFQSEIPKVFWGLAIINTCFMSPLNSIHHLDKTYRTIAMVVVELLFSQFYTPRSLFDIWIIVGSSFKLYFNIIELFYGKNEQKFLIYKYHKALFKKPQKYTEQSYCLSPLFKFFNIDCQIDKNKISHRMKDLQKEWVANAHPYRLSSKFYWLDFTARSLLVIRQIVSKSSETSFKLFFNHVYQKSFGTSSSTSSSNSTGLSLYNSSLCSLMFLKTLLGGKSGTNFLILYICEQFLDKRTPFDLTMNYSYVKKRHSIEFVISSAQINTTPREIIKKFPFGLCVYVQEFHDESIHNVDFEKSDNIQTHISHAVFVRGESLCKGHKVRRSFKRKFIQIDNNLSDNSKINSFDNYVDDCVMFCFADPEFYSLYGRIENGNSDVALYQKVEYSKDPLLQMIGIKALKIVDTKESIKVVISQLKVKKGFWRIKYSCFKTIFTILQNITNPDKLNSLREFFPNLLYRIAFGYRNETDVTQPNNFSNFSEYFLKLALIKLLRKTDLPTLNPYQNEQNYFQNSITSNVNIRQISLKMAQEYLLSARNLLTKLLKSNNNTSNLFLDCCYKKKLLKALSYLATTFKKRNLLTDDFTDFLVYEIIDSMNTEVLLPSYHYCLLSASLESLSLLMNDGIIDRNDELFFYYSEFGINENVRKAAVKGMVRFCQSKNDNQAILIYLIEKMCFDHSEMIQEAIAKELLKFPPIFEIIDINTPSKFTYNLNEIYHKILSIIVNHGYGKLHMSHNLAITIECIFLVMFCKIENLAQLLIPKDVSIMENTYKIKKKNRFHNPQVIKLIEDGKSVKILIKLSNEEILCKDEQKVI